MLRLLISIVAALASTQPAMQHASFHKTISKEVGYDYAARLPRDVNDGQKHPLIIFLHGSGECGHDLGKVEKVGVLKSSLVNKKDFPFIIIAPQMPDYDGWWDRESLDALLDHVLEKYPVDRDRVYLTGISLGGYGVWDWACHRPNAFAAIVPIAGEGNDDWADRLKRVPVWAFHGAKDKAVSPAEEERMVNAVKAAGGDAKLTMYPDCGHNAWTKAYEEPELFAWLLSKKRN